MRVRVLFLVSTIVFYGALALLVVLAPRSGGLYEQRVILAPFVVGIPSVGWAVFRLVRPPRGVIDNAMMIGSTATGGRYRWDLREVERFGFGERMGESFIERALPPSSNGRGLRRVYLEPDGIEAARRVLVAHGWQEPL